MENYSRRRRDSTNKSNKLLFFPTRIYPILITGLAFAVCSMIVNDWQLGETLQYAKIVLKPQKGLPPPYSSEVCLERRGTLGRWVLDWEYANRSAYPNHGSYSSWHLAYQNFTATPSQPHRLATAYRWVDDECPVREVDPIGFCRACAVLGIDRILVLGDSINIEFVQSLQSLLGFPPEGRRATGFQARFRPWTMACPEDPSDPSSVGTHRQTITFQMMRMSPYDDWKNLGAQAQTRTGKARDFVKATPRKTAIVANLGDLFSITLDKPQQDLHL